MPVEEGLSKTLIINKVDVQRLGALGVWHIQTSSTRCLNRCGPFLASRLSPIKVIGSRTQPATGGARADSWGGKSEQIVVIDNVCRVSGAITVHT